MKRDDSVDDHLPTVRAAEEKIEQMLDDLDGAARDPESENRQSERLRYRVRACSITLQHPGSSSPTRIAVPTRNLSVRGIAFLHGGFVHTGTSCRVTLAGADGMQTEVPGKVLRCRYVEDLVHEVAVEFDRDIDPQEFCRAQQAPAVGGRRDAARHDIGRFLEHLPADIAQLKEALIADGDQQLESVVRSLQSGATECGCQPVADAAAELLRLLDHGSPADALRKQVEELERICREVGAPPRQGPSNPAAGTDR